MTKSKGSNVTGYFFHFGFLFIESGDEINERITVSFLSNA